MIITQNKTPIILVHSGIKGQKWGERRYQNEDGSLTEEGLIRYRGMRQDREAKINAKKHKIELKTKKEIEFKKQNTKIAVDKNITKAQIEKEKTKRYKEKLNVKKEEKINKDAMKTAQYVAELDHATTKEVARQKTIATAIIAGAAVMGTLAVGDMVQEYHKETESGKLKRLRVSMGLEETEKPVKNSKNKLNTNAKNAKDTNNKKTDEDKNDKKPKKEIKNEKEDQNNYNNAHNEKLSDLKKRIHTAEEIQSAYDSGDLKKAKQMLEETRNSILLGEQIEAFASGKTETKSERKKKVKNAVSAVGITIGSSTAVALVTALINKGVKPKEKRNGLGVLDVVEAGLTGVSSGIKETETQLKSNTKKQEKK